MTKSSLANDVVLAHSNNYTHGRDGQKICKIIVKRRSVSPSPSVTCIDDPITGTDLSLHIHDGYVDILDTDGKRYICHEKDIYSIACFPAKKEEKDG